MPPDTAIGVSEQLYVPENVQVLAAVAPSCDWSLFPQQYAWPDWVTPQVCSLTVLLLLPSSIWNSSPPATAVGTVRNAVPPVPDWPALLLLQQKATPLAASPQRTPSPSVTCWNETPFPAGVGVVVMPDAAPLPKELDSPQQYSAEAFVSAQVAKNPVLTRWKPRVALLMTAAGTLVPTPTAPLPSCPC